MTAAYFEDHPTDPDKVILRKPRLDQGPDYERGFIDGMMYQTQTTVNKAVSAMSKRTWVGLTDSEMLECLKAVDVATAVNLLMSQYEMPPTFKVYAEAIQAKLKEKNHG
jgi:hypothetical protein